MNERIEELAGQAFQYASDHADDSGKGSLGVFAERFAELLVKECAVVINADIEAQIKDGIISNVHGLNQARDLIQQHFRS